MTEKEKHIPRKFSMSGGVKRKALLAVPTICRYCHRPFLDKVYDVGRHKVTCTKCGKVNAVTDFPTMEKLKEMALNYDLGTAGTLGGFSQGTDIRDVKEHVEKSRGYKLADYLELIRKGDDDRRRQDKRRNKRDD